MDSFIVEDVNELIKLKKGDRNRLNHIKERCLANEIISISDRKYIERLCSQYLQQQNNDEPKKQDFIIKESDSGTPQEPKVESLIETEPTKALQPIEKKNEYVSSRHIRFIENKKILFAVGAIVLGLILIAFVAIEYDGLIPDNNIITNNPLEDFSLDTDNSSYQTGDIISISGQIKTSDGKINVSIENEREEAIWQERLNVKDGGEFSTLLIAGGNGWENSGKYTLKAESSDEIKQISFEFIVN